MSEEKGVISGTLVKSSLCLIVSTVGPMDMLMEVVSKDLVIPASYCWYYETYGYDYGGSVEGLSHHCVF